MLPRWLNWFQSGFERKSMPNRLRRPVVPCRPRVEGLEDRCLLSAGVTLFPLPLTPSGTIGAPLGFIDGPDGNVWYYRNLDNVIGKITPAGQITEFPTLGVTVLSLAVGPDNNLWFTEISHAPGGGHTRGEITPNGVITEFNPPSITAAFGQ